MSSGRACSKPTPRRSEGDLMKAAKLLDMTVDELVLEESKLTDQIFMLRFQIAASQAENPAIGGIR